MQRLETYLFVQCGKVVVGLALLALSILTLERLIRIFELVSNTSDSVGAVIRMVLNLLPFYLGYALPSALFIGVLITIDRVSRSGELSAALAAGVSLFQVARPFVFMGTGLAVFSIVLTGFLQPYTRYDYRQTVDLVKQQSFEAAFQEGKFAAIGHRVFWTQDRAGGSGALGQVFIFEAGREEGEEDRITTAQTGRVARGLDRADARILLNEGESILISPEQRVIERLDFGRVNWNIDSDIIGFRARGEDARELSIIELVQALLGDRRYGVPAGEARAELHDQLARAALYLLLPVLAIPLGLGYGRSFQSTGIVVGVIILVVIQRALEAGKALVASGAAPGWVGAWPVIGVVAVVALYLFLRSALRVTTPPLMLLSFDIASALRAGFARLMPRRFAPRTA